MASKNISFLSTLKFLSKKKAQNWLNLLVHCWKNSPRCLYDHSCPKLEVLCHWYNIAHEYLLDYKVVCPSCWHSSRPPFDYDPWHPPCHPPNQCQALPIQSHSDQPWKRESQNHIRSSVKGQKLMTFPLSFNISGKFFYHHYYCCYSALSFRTYQSDTIRCTLCQNKFKMSKKVFCSLAPILISKLWPQMSSVAKNEF